MRYAAVRYVTAALQLWFAVHSPIPRRSAERMVTIYAGAILVADLTFCFTRRIVRNSWGTSWGNAGYIWVEAGHNVCGIATDATVTSPGCFDPKTTKGYKDCSTYN